MFPLIPIDGADLLPVAVVSPGGQNCNYPVQHQHLLEVSALTARLFPGADGKPLIAGSTDGKISIKFPLDEAAETAVLHTLIDRRRCAASARFTGLLW